LIFPAPILSASATIASSKVEDDYRIDFLSQILRFVNESSSEEASGPILAAQVRATDGNTRPRVKLNREDSMNLLRQTQATALIAVGPDEPYLHYLFVEETFIDRLSEVALPHRSIPPIG
jgi:hypothetical protein